MTKANQKIPFLFTLMGLLFWNLCAREPSTTITSDRMEMLRFKSHNEFTFDGNVELKSKDFQGSCMHMWVYTEMEEKFHYSMPWCFLFPIKPRTIMWHSWLEAPKPKADNAGIGQIKRIIAQKKVFLKTKDPETGEIKESNSEKAVIYPREGKMVLTGNPVVRCSIQGTFHGGKITFFKANDRVLVEDIHPGQRSTVVLGE